MTLDRVRLHTFRNHQASAIDGTGRFNLLIGANGAGKTNVLEALSLLAPGRGLRRAALSDLPSKRRDGDRSGGFAVSATLASPAGEVMLGTGAEQGSSRRDVRINGAREPAVRLSEWLAVVWLTPAMDRLWIEGASGRRRFLDRLVLGIEPGHAAIALRYETALRERNRLLAADEAPDPQWLASLEAGMAESGAALAAGRARLIARLEETLKRNAGGPFALPELSYRPAGAEEVDRLAQMLGGSRSADRAAGRTLVGPHRDDLSVSLADKGMPAADCSTGEQKAMLIAIVLAHAELLGRERPLVLLLDEVAAHLDPERRAALFARLDRANTQVWLTGTEAPPFASIGAGARIYRVDDGTVIPD